MESDSRSSEDLSLKYEDENSMNDSSDRESFTLPFSKKRSWMGRHRNSICVHFFLAILNLSLFSLLVIKDRTSRCVTQGLIYSQFWCFIFFRLVGIFCWITGFHNSTCERFSQTPSTRLLDRKSKSKWVHGNDRLCGCSMAWIDAKYVAHAYERILVAIKAKPWCSRYKYQVNRGWIDQTKQNFGAIGRWWFSRDAFRLPWASLSGKRASVSKRGLF